ncbi:hypothetical protein AVEN_252776-1 [Araneus ventricosus]|uniref:Uncharacterized protein n=1 Tax=Araneus ventricosus TaxID=182803 RepID=A0A4Y2MI87_ARAVE|nr:hypothetical protein AVEN_252776-1 [Araneus ventricosus]
MSIPGLRIALTQELEDLPEEQLDNVVLETRHPLPMSIPGLRIALIQELEDLPEEQLVNLVLVLPTHFTDILASRTKRTVYLNS